MTENPQIFSDKIRLAGILIAKEMLMINFVNRLKTNAKIGKFEEGRKNEFSEWASAWMNISELYDFLKDGYLSDLKKKHQEVEEQLVEIMKKYNDPKGDLTYKEMLFAYDGILRLMQISQFHNVYRQGESGDFVEEET